MVFTCIITGCEPEDPVYYVDDGQTYERDAIVRYLNEYRHTGRTPVGLPIVLGRLIPNNVIKMKYTRCPLSNSEIRNPIIVANDGHTYDKDALVNEFRRTICIGDPITLPSGICTYTLDMYHNFAFNDMRSSVNSSRIDQTVNNSNLIINHRSDTESFRVNDIVDNWTINGDIHRRIKFDILRELRTIDQSNSVFNKKFMSCNVIINGKYTDCVFINCIVRCTTSRSMLSNCVFRNCVFKYCDFTTVSIRSTCIMINCIQRNTFGIDSRIMLNEIVWTSQ